MLIINATMMARGALSIAGTADLISKSNVSIAGEIDLGRPI